jgi:hypothetical protein
MTRSMHLKSKIEFQPLIEAFRNRGRGLQILLAVAPTLIAMLFVDWSHGFSGDSTLFIFIVAVVIAPFVEVLLFQKMGLHLTQQVFGMQPFFAMVVVTVVHAALHTGDPLRPFYLAPQLMAYNFLYLALDVPGGRPFLWTWFTHAFANFMIFAATWAYFNVYF